MLQTSTARARLTEETLEALLLAQNGVLAVHQAAPWLTLRELHAEVAAGRWQRPLRGVVVAHNGALTRSQEIWVALLSAPPRSALAGPTALELDGMTGFLLPEIWVTVPAHARRARRAGLRVLSSRHLGELDVRSAQSPRRTRPARSILDAAAATPYERRARALVLAGVQQGLVRPADLREALGRRGRMRHHALVVESIADAEGGIASLPEHDFDLIRIRAGLPPPSRQQVLRTRDGRCYLDVRWERLRLVVEIHGVQHFQQFAWDMDLDRIGEITAAGNRVLQLTSHAVRHEQERVLSQLVRCAAV